ncbi:MAG: MerR family transcriptional regulator [Spirochaetia bacterium]|jgi:DNA-binding transcriptional MerR regulator|nr:MerR family transcriptional regulator [Spirochaetia bacterium]
MKSYSTGEVEALLGLPASTLRFWEKEVPFLAPRKDLFGRRAYSPLDLCVLARLKRLALVRDLGLKAACRAMEEEITRGDPSLKAEILELRTQLFSLFSDLRELQKPALSERNSHEASLEGSA